MAMRAAQVSPPPVSSKESSTYCHTHPALKVGYSYAPTTYVVQHLKIFPSYPPPLPLLDTFLTMIIIIIM